MVGAALLRKRWLAGPLVGAAIGLPVLGAGGRVAMRGIALLDGVPGAFTVEGTITVLLLGAANGALGGAIRALLDLGGRLPLAARTALFALACLLLTLRGLRPLDAARLGLFLPLVAVYVAAVELTWRRLPRRAPTADDARVAASPVV